MQECYSLTGDGLGRVQVSSFLLLQRCSHLCSDDILTDWFSDVEVSCWYWPNIENEFMDCGSEVILRLAAFGGAWDHWLQLCHFERI